MAVDDIYRNKEKYYRFLENLNDLLIDPKKREKKLGKYYCKNPSNLKYFTKLHNRYEALDNSYIRRLRVFGTLKIIVYCTEKDLKDLDRDDIDEIVAFMHTSQKSPASKKDFILHIKQIWKILFPEEDERGRLDERVTPYPVRHLRNKIDVSKKVQSWDPLTPEEFDRVVDYFDYYPSMQCFLVLAHDALIRPQELCWRKIKDVMIFDDRVEVVIRDHGKKGSRTTWSFRALQYVLSWMKRHPSKDNSESYFLLNKKGTMFKPTAVNKLLKTALKELKINKKITAYKLNHQGITEQFANPSIIQKKRGWTGLDQLKVYDHSNYAQVMNLEREIRTGVEDFVVCSVCNSKNRKGDVSCENCKRRLDGRIDNNKTVDYLDRFFRKPEVREMFMQMVREGV